MEDYSFIIDGMTWSFSRINSFYNNCKLEWKRHYIDCEPLINSFDGQVGGFAHKCLEKYFKGELSEFELAPYFEEHYKDEVTMYCPYPNGDTKYEKILEYFKNFSFDKDKYEILGVEKEVRFKVGDYDCVGYIDLLYKDKTTGEITLMDHKSSTIKVTKKGTVSKSDVEHFEAFKRQQYLYSKVILEEYGRVDYLRWNMFKDGTTISINWNEEEYKNTFNWAEETIKSIEKENEFPPSPSYFYCNSLCSIRHSGCPYKRLGMIYDGIYSKCYNSKNKDYMDYGGVGIEMCDDWKNDKMDFFNWALESGFADDKVLKRYDESLGFDFFNCYWDWRDDNFIN